MNIAYFRKSSFSVEETLEHAKKEAKRLGLTILGTTDLPGKNGVILHICNPAWIGNLIASDENLIGLLPCSVAVIQTQDNVRIGVGSPTVLGSISRHPAINALADQAQSTLSTLVDSAAGVGPRKAKKLKLYSTTTCPYCKAEASWLDTHNVTYDEVHVDHDEKEAEEMVKKTGQMGVPVTAVTYEDGEEEFIVGFDQHRLAAIVQNMNSK